MNEEQIEFLLGEVKWGSRVTVVSADNEGDIVFTSGPIRYLPSSLTELVDIRVGNTFVGYFIPSLKKFTVFPTVKELHI